MFRAGYLREEVVDGALNGLQIGQVEPDNADVGLWLAGDLNEVGGGGFGLVERAAGNVDASAVLQKDFGGLLA